MSKEELAQLGERLLAIYREAEKPAYDATDATVRTDKFWPGVARKTGFIVDLDAVGSGSALAFVGDPIGEGMPYPVVSLAEAEAAARRMAEQKVAAVRSAPKPGNGCLYVEVWPAEVVLLRDNRKLKFSELSGVVGGEVVLHGRRPDDPLAVPIVEAGVDPASGEANTTVTVREGFHWVQKPKAPSRSQPVPPAQPGPDGKWRIDYRTDKAAPFGCLMDLKTGREIDHAVFFDEETGEWEQYVVENGVWQWASPGVLATRKGQGRIKFYPRRDTADEPRQQQTRGPDRHKAT